MSPLHHTRAESHRALYPRLLVAAIIHAGIAGTQWGVASRFWALWLLFVCYCAVSVALARLWERENPAIVVAKFVANTGLVVASGYLSVWSLATWMYLVFMALSRDSSNFRSLRLSCAGTILVACGFAVAEHAASLGMLTYALISLATYASAERRLRFTCGMLDELAQKNAQLQQAHTELAAMHERAVEQAKLSGLGMLAAGIAHEINNPMSYVTANLETLIDDLRARHLDETMTEYATELLPATLDGARRVNAIVGDLRRFARGDTQGMVEYDLNDQVRAAVRIMHSNIVHRCDLELAFRELPRATGLPQQLVQVFINLLANAIDAYPEAERGHIRVTTSHVGHELRASITDRGVGMSSDVRAKVFEPFFTTKTVGRGTGLGLSVAYGIVNAHGGSIEIESAPGQGSTFTVRLPLQPGLAKLASAAAAMHAA